MFWINVANKMFISTDNIFRSVLHSLGSNSDMFYTDSTVPNIMDMLLIIFTNTPGKSWDTSRDMSVLVSISFVLSLLYSRWYDPILLFGHIWTVCDLVFTDYACIICRYHWIKIICCLKSVEVNHLLLDSRVIDGVIYLSTFYQRQYVSVDKS